MLLVRQSTENGMSLRVVNVLVSKKRKSKTFVDIRKDNVPDVSGAVSFDREFSFS